MKKRRQSFFNPFAIGTGRRKCENQALVRASTTPALDHSESDNRRARLRERRVEPPGADATGLAWQLSVVEAPPLVGGRHAARRAVLLPAAGIGHARRNQAAAAARRLFVLASAVSFHSFHETKTHFTHREGEMMKSNFWPPSVRPVSSLRKSPGSASGMCPVGPAGRRGRGRGGRVGRTRHVPN
jgi:hypothetical protein